MNLVILLGSRRLFEHKYAVIVKTNTKNQILTDIEAFKKAYPEYSGLTIDDDVISNDMFIANIMTSITALALSQVEETFCDAVGLFLFGRSYVYAFHYLLAPGVGGPRVQRYPTLTSRAYFMATYGDVDLPSLGFANFVNEFTENTATLSPRSTFLLRLADRITGSLAQELYREANDLIEFKASMMRSNSAKETEIIKMFRAGVPAKAPGSLASILNAGWDYIIDERTKTAPRPRPLFEWTSELIFKTIEVSEYERRIGA